MKLTSYVCIGNTNGKHDKLILPAGDVLIHTGGYTTCWVPDGVISSKKVFNTLSPEPPDDIIDWMHEQPFKYKLMVPSFRDVVTVSDFDFYKHKFNKAGIKVGILECMTIAGIGVGCYNYRAKYYNQNDLLPNSPLLIHTQHLNILSSIGVPHNLDILITIPLTTAETINYVPNDPKRSNPHHDVIFNLVPRICLFSGAETGKTLPVKIIDTTCYNTSVWYENKQVSDIVQFYIAAGGPKYDMV